MWKPHRPCAVFAFACALILAGFALVQPAVWAQPEAGSGIEFRPSGSPGPDTIYLRGIGSDDPGGLLKLEVWANEVSDLYGVGFTLRFPQTLLRFPKSRSKVYFEGPFLNDGGLEETFLLVRQIDDEITVGLTRTGEAPGVSGTGHLLTLEFRGRDLAGKKLFRLRRTSVFDSNGAKVESARWLAGKVFITLPE